MSRSSSSRPQPSIGGLAADGDEDLVGREPGFAAVRGLDRAAPRPPATTRLRLGAGQDLDAERVQALGDRPRQLGIVVRQDARHRLDHRHLRAELGEGGAELQPDIAGADDDEPFRHVAVSDSASVDEMTGPPNGRDGSSTGTEPVAITTCLGADDLRAGLGLDLDRLAVAKSRPSPATILTPAFFSRPETPLVRRPTMPSFQAIVRARSSAGCCDRDAEAGFAPQLPR